MQELIRDQKARTYLEKCNSVYEVLSARILKLSRKGDPERVLEWVQMAAQFCWTAHPGHYADGRMENPALEIGRRLEFFLPQPPAGARATVSRCDSSSRQRVLHVATTVYSIGGHSRLIKSWSENDEDSTHSLLLTRQERFPVPAWLSQAVRSRAGTLTVLPDTLSIMERARWLKEVARDCADLIVIHTNPDDVIPIVAFADSRVPPVALMNHADHVFWLGSSVADVVIDMRSFGKELSEARRFAKRSMLLPLPLDFKEQSLSREEARRRLNLKESDVVLLSIGSSYKYKPTDAHNFYETVNIILERNPTAQFYLVGVGPTQGKEDSGKAPHERAHYLGTLDDPSLYQMAADIYLEGFPYGSLTALLETAALGVCPVVMFAPPMPYVDNADSLGGKGRVKSNQTQEEYVQYVTSLIDDAGKQTRIGRQSKEFVVSTHSRSAWKERLEPIYQYLHSIKHQPSPIPDSDFMATASDLGLSAFQMKQHRGSLLQVLVDQNFNRLSFRDMMWLFFLSHRMRDDAFSYAEQSIWAGLFKAKALKKRGAGF